MDNSSIKRVKVKRIDEILGQPFKILDDGFIRVIDYMGSDESIVQAARVSYGKGTRKVNEDKALIRYLLRHRHTSPFEMCEIKLHVRVPMDTWRQWIRHRTANVNEYSTRYSVAIESAYLTKEEEWRIQSSNNKQGSDGFLDIEKGKYLSKKEKEIHKKINEIYQERLKLEVAREQARKILPLSTYTEAYWKIDLHNLLHFLALRMDMRAQFEIRSYANIISNEIVKRWCPITWEAFKTYELNSIHLSEIEVLIIGLVLKKNFRKINDILRSNSLITVKDNKLIKSRELLEIEEKLLLLNLPIEW